MAPLDPAFEALFKALHLDWDGLLSPLAEGGGGGIDLRYSPEMDALAEARRKDDEGDRGIWISETKRADLHDVVARATDILATRSKDMQVAVWLAQALVTLHGLKGLAAGLELLAGFAEEGWDYLWPRSENGDLEAKLAPYLWLDVHLTSEVLQVEITEPPPGHRFGVIYQAMIKARKLRQNSANNPNEQEEGEDTEELSLARIDEIISTTSDEFFVDRLDTIRLALKALEHLLAALDHHAGADAPSLASLRQVIRDLGRIFSQILEQRGHARPQPLPEEAPDAAAGPQFVPAPPIDFPQISDRRTAYALLDFAADWLLAKEPHSPAPYLVKRAVSWENILLRDLLEQLLARGTELDVVFQVLGIGDDGGPATAARRNKLFSLGS